ncbi:LOW QUALITY PROTEIN: gamma-butyrobetaine dioxygenase [Drosophila obscura]|uniref:LOW QUALITY PROTEIN: gamma-butyrobetaine dioxygenase n=1 Tax=Drosophila obscura TaxID=7282 RepID=UPI001BB1052A|nr:LOW QUALITY PROTEIN: gamma-butyrobetaine dioxygenase [Drosophila obscura]
MWLQRLGRVLGHGHGHGHGQGQCRRHLSARIVQGTSIVVQPESESEGREAMTFPGVWLRDNCRCTECFHGSSRSRRLDWDSFDTRVRPVGVRTDQAAGQQQQQQLHVRWSDAHESSYPLDWLRQRSFDGRRQRAYLDEFYRPATRHWAGAEFQRIARHFDYGQVMAEDAALQQWLQALAVYGVALLRDAPLDGGVVRRLAERVGFIRRTTYGEEFVVQAKPGAQNFAYLSLPLPLHTDLPYYEYKPSVNILHCVTQTASPGGSNLLVDAFHIADRLRGERPADFERLCRVPVDWNDIGSEDGREFHNIWRAPVICLDAEGKYTRINHSVPQRDSHFSVPLAEVEPWYESYGRFVRLARDDAHAFKTRPGDVLTFNNIRLLHGRTGYDDTEHNSRYIVGAYLDWDIVYSRLRVLKKRSAAVQ